MSEKRGIFMGDNSCPHSINDDLRRKSMPLACRILTRPHTYERIAHLLQSIHADCRLDYDKILATIMDNGSNFVKAVKQFGVELKPVT